MKASAFEFRFRLWIAVAIYVLGFVAPWDLRWHVDGTGPNAHVWAQLAVVLSRNGLMGIGAAFNLMLMVGIVLATAGAWMRTWGSAYLSVDVMSDSSMRSDTVVADGPFRYLRNPLYVGTWLSTFSLALLMPVSGAVFTIVLIILFQVRLIFAEEAFLRGKLGTAYMEYCAKVPRLVPAFRAKFAASGARPQWGRAALAEIFLWGMALSFVTVGWWYDADLLLRCVLVWFGISMIARAVQPQRLKAV